MSLIVKICGLSTEETLDAALEAGADMVGFNFFPKSPRFISVARAAELADRARGRAEIVALTVDMAMTCAPRSTRLDQARLGATSRSRGA